MRVQQKDPFSVSQNWREENRGSGCQSDLAEKLGRNNKVVAHRPPAPTHRTTNRRAASLSGRQLLIAIRNTSV